MNTEVNTHRLLEYICNEGLEGELIEFAIWKIALKYLGIEYTDIQKREKILEVCDKEIDKWVKRVA